MLDSFRFQSLNASRDADRILKSGSFQSGLTLCRRPADRDQHPLRRHFEEDNYGLILTVILGFVFFVRSFSVSLESTNEKNSTRSLARRLTRPSAS